MVAILFAIIIFCFWYFLYPHAIVAQERLFVWDSEFWQEYGLWQYVRDFFAQFFHFASVGALLSALACVVVQLLSWWLLSRIGKWKTFLFVVSFVPALFVWHLMFSKFTINNDETSYDWLLRRGRWTSILQKNYPSSMACQNVVRLAQYQTGRISENEMFDELTLTNDVLGSRTAAYMMSDVYMYAGMVNMAQRASFEAMASIEDFSMSGRALKRLTETSLITGQYQVALKYISILEKTFFF